LARRERSGKAKERPTEDKVREGKRRKEGQEKDKER